MSNTGSLNATDAGLEQRSIETVRTVLAACMLTVLTITFTPFQTQAADTAVSGNIVNQLGYGALGAIGLLAHLMFTERRVAASLIRPAWLLLLALLVLSVTQSNWPDKASRSVLFSLMAMLMATAAICLPPHARSLRACLSVMALSTLGLSYFGVVAWPDMAIHGSGGDEPQHVGLWRGIYPHKNVAGPVMAALFFVGLYLLRSGEKGVGWIVMILSAVFVYKTGSKTTAGLVPLVALIVVGSRLTGGRWLPVAILLAVMTVMGFLTIGAAISPTLDAMLQAILPGTTFTGRMDLWRFALDVMAPRQWTGFGFESFWQTPIVEGAEAPFDLSWDPRGIVNSHSGFLDIAIAMGWPALVVGVATLVVLPMADYVRCRKDEENQRLADLFLMILAFALLNSFLESFLLKRNDPVWMLTWVSIVALRLLSRFRVEP